MGCAVAVPIASAWCDCDALHLARFNESTTIGEHCAGPYANQHRCQRHTFTNVANGTYFAHFDLPNGYLVSPLAVGLNPATGDSTDFIVSQTNSNITVNAPLVQKPTAIELAAFSADVVSAAKCGNPSGADCVRLTLANPQRILCRGIPNCAKRWRARGGHCGWTRHSSCQRHGRPVLHPGCQHPAGKNVTPIGWWK